MNKAILVVGESGHGKTTSLLNLPPETTLLINTIGKDVPLIGSRKKYIPFAGDTGNVITPPYKDGKTLGLNLYKMLRALTPDMLERFDYIILDDFQYIMSFEYMARAQEGGWERFNDIAVNANNILSWVRATGNTKNVAILAHADDTGKMKTIGKMLSEKITPEGLFTVVLRTDPEKSVSTGGVESYRFRTQTAGESDPAKSPMGMFPLHIDNDLKLVFDRMDEYANDGLTIEESKVITQNTK